jgi:flagellar motor switch protein FliM
MLGAPLAPFVFPPTDRPSAGFVTRFERALRTVPEDALAAPFSLRLGGCVEAPLTDCLASMGQTSRYSVIAIGDARGLIVVPDALLHTLTEFAYGGDGSEPDPVLLVPTPLGMRYAERVAVMFADALRVAVPDATGDIVSVTDEPGEAVAMKTLVRAFGFEIMVGDTSLGALGFCVPVRALAAIENAAAGSAPDTHWAARVEHALGHARLNVRCVLARPTLSAGEVSRLTPGSVIPIATLNEVALIAGGYRIATGVADARNGRAAIVINRTEFHS